MVCLDTSILIDILREDVDTEELERYLEKQNISIPSPIVFELWVGVLLRDRAEKEKEKIRGLIEFAEILEMDAESSIKGAEIYSKLVKEEREIPPLDALIAGVVKTNREKLITKDEHFRRVEGLDVDVWKI